ncbi:TrmH family RNA methyltransferase [Actinomadura keratinilytica]|uniref:tRNA/rRNA methyltransferase SpoU type domain-containing protein n=1 Tax=Actinomadura keratinilytica TaxID=547461 RepID=A0ABP7ZBQ6_9ACTN
MSARAGRHPRPAQISGARSPDVRAPDVRAPDAEAAPAAARPAIRVRSPRELRRHRRSRAHSCWDHLIAAPLWPLHGANLGTLLRTCDAVGACLAVPRFRWVPEALARGNTLRRPSCVHWVGDPLGWLARQRDAGTRVVGVELADEAVRLADLPPARGRTVAVLGHEQYGIPDEALDLLDLAVEIPMVGTGASLNVAVAGSLVLYKLAGLL